MKKAHFKLFKKKKVKIGVNRQLVQNLIEESNYIISKKDLGHIINMILSNPKKLMDNEIKEYINYKYNIETIASHLRKTNKKVIPFKKLMSKLNISKRKFYPRLRILKKFYTKSEKFNWSIKRGKFIRKEVL